MNRRDWFRRALLLGAAPAVATAAAAEQLATGTRRLEVDELVVHDSLVAGTSQMDDGTKYYSLVVQKAGVDRNRPIVVVKQKTYL